eukprot:362672-Chlamydomonas_euryale.AAC.5
MPAGGACMRAKARRNRSRQWLGQAVHRWRPACAYPWRRLHAHHPTPTSHHPPNALVRWRTPPECQTQPCPSPGLLRPVMGKASADVMKEATDRAARAQR